MTDPEDDLLAPPSMSMRALTAASILGVIGWIVILLFLYEALKWGGW